jgi:hypothetical protein
VVAAQTGVLEVVCDVSDPAQVSACVDVVVGRFGRTVPFDPRVDVRGYDGS